MGRGFGALNIQHLCGQVKSTTRHLVSNGEDAGIDPDASSIISAQCSCGYIIWCFYSENVYNISQCLSIFPEVIAVRMAIMWAEQPFL